MSMAEKNLAQEKNVSFFFSVLKSTATICHSLVPPSFDRSLIYIVVQVLQAWSHFPWSFIKRCFSISSSNSSRITVSLQKCLNSLSLFCHNLILNSD